MATIVSSPSNATPTTESENTGVSEDVATDDAVTVGENPESVTQSANEVENGDEEVVLTKQTTVVVTENVPKKRGRKRKVVVEKETAPRAQDEETESEPEKPLEKKPRGRPVGSTNKMKKQVGRPKKSKQATDDSETEDESDALEKRVSELPANITAKYGNIVWVKMAGYPYWPALITDPRRLPSAHQKAALKDLATKYYVRFYKTSDFSATLFKNVEAWEDTKANYREGFPVKDAKAPKRRVSLMEAIQLADADYELPIEERMNGLLKVTENKEQLESKKLIKTKDSVPGKRGRPFGSKNKPKGKTDEEHPTSSKLVVGRGRKKSSTRESGVNDEAVSEPTSEPSPTMAEEEDDTSTPALSKDEIKAKVASRKAPSKKKAIIDAAGDSKTKVNTKIDSIPKSEMDSKRKKEIELVVPRKSVKSSDIRQATDEAAQKKLGAAKEKIKDTLEYTVGSLVDFALKMTKLRAHESSQNNNELIRMMTQLFQETRVHRADVERSGIAAIITVLRKSSNPTVSKTASAVRKHLLKVLTEDAKISNEVAQGREASSKKHKVKNDEDGNDAAPKKQKTDTKSPECAVVTSPTKKEASTIEPKSAHAKKEETERTVVTSPTKKEATTIEPKSAHATKEEKNDSSSKLTTDKPIENTQTINKPIENTEVLEETTGNSSIPQKVDSVKSLASSPKKKAVVVTAFEIEKADPMADKNRKNCIEMLSKALKSNGDAHLRIAKEIEEQVFDRFKESNDDYRASARTITFGLKNSATLRERLFNGDLHALEVAYATDEFFNV